MLENFAHFYTMLRSLNFYITKLKPIKSRLVFTRGKEFRSLRQNVVKGPKLNSLLRDQSKDSITVPKKAVSDDSTSDIGCDQRLRLSIN